ncbi:MAG: PadR family transcriptional regulator [Rhodanobacteraceae bacterium]|nr:PadR family transcriptional regulator [Rhodanobacteraceae bacterium]MBL0040145.1 PadR family transcriptional regulator [Xanthomonadales bacterium]MBP6078499.1 PadR family transcriptional regulator [Xanthomonadales bacterium]
MTDTELFLKKFQKELAAGTVSLVLLTVLSRATQPLYGYQIAKLLEGSSEGVIAGKQSALYPVLRNLEGAGLAESEVEPSISGPPRRYYHITELGREVQREWAESWSATRDFVDRTLIDQTLAEKTA